MYYKRRFHSYHCGAETRRKIRIQERLLREQGQTLGTLNPPERPGVITQTMEQIQECRKCRSRILSITNVGKHCSMCGTTMFVQEGDWVREAHSLTPAINYV